MNDFDVRPERRGPVGTTAVSGRRGFLLWAARGLLAGGLALVTGGLLSGRRRPGTSATRRLDCPGRGACSTCPRLGAGDGCELPQAELARRAALSEGRRWPGRDERR